MDIEALYPFVAVAYGTFGLGFGVFLWWKTQRRIDVTRHAIEQQVAAAVTDISNQVETKLGEGAAIDTGAITATVASEIKQFLLTEKQEQAREIQAQLQNAGIEEMMDEAKGQLAAQVPMSMVQAQKAINFKVSKKYAAENPIAAYALELGKLGLAQMLESQGAFGEFLGGAIENSPRRRLASNSQGGEWSPGVR